jgi:predicted nucleic acid-binding protein
VIVLDASAVLALLLGNAAIAARIGRAGESLAAPHLLDVEVAHVLRRLQAAGELSEERGRQALEDLADLDVDRYPHCDFLPRVWELRRNLTAYDAVYVALAEALRAPLLTLDERLAASPGHRARVELAS